MNFIPTHAVSAGLVIVAVAYCRYYHNQYLTQITPNMSKTTSKFLPTIPERTTYFDPVPWEKLRMHMTCFQTINQLDRKRTCEDFAREEMAGEAAVWAYIRTHHGLKKELTLDPRFCGGRRF
jgi:hypothetical protein